MTEHLFGPAEKEADISGDGRYRYWLTRRWNDDLPVMGFVMLNPSLADDERDDRTLRRCVDFAKREQCGSVQLVNLYAFRTPHPEELRNTGDPVGPENDKAQARFLVEVQRVVVGWGSGLRHLPVWRDALGLFMRQASLLHFGPLECLGCTRDGSPRHPLYLPAHATIIPWEVPEWAASAERDYSARRRPFQRQS